MFWNQKSSQMFIADAKSCRPTIPVFPLDWRLANYIKFQAQWCSAAAGNLPQKLYFNDKMLVFSSLAELVLLAG